MVILVDKIGVSESWMRAVWISCKGFILSYLVASMVSLFVCNGTIFH